MAEVWGGFLANDPVTFIGGDAGTFLAELPDRLPDAEMLRLRQSAARAARVQAETLAYGTYVNGRARAASHLRHEDLAEYDADLAKARAAMEAAWLEAVPTREEPA